MMVNLHGTTLLIRCCMNVPAHSTTAELHAKLVCFRMEWNRQTGSQCKPLCKAETYCWRLAPRFMH